MLANEVKPFADHHIQSLEEVRGTLRSILSSYEGTAVGITEDMLKQDVKKINDAINALVRFKVCMVDEHAQKERLRKIAMDHRMNCS